MTDEYVDHKSMKVLSFDKIERKKSTGSGKKIKIESNDELNYEQIKKYKVRFNKPLAKENLPWDIDFIIHSAFYNLKKINECRVDKNAKFVKLKNTKDIIKTIPCSFNVKAIN
jgi:hypothetical protein